MYEFLDFLKTFNKGSPCSEVYAIVDIFSMADENGVFYSTTRGLMNRWGWSNTKVVSFMSELEYKDVIKTQKRHKKDTKYLVNTRLYGMFLEEKKTQKRHKKDTGDTDLAPPKNVDTYKRIVDYFNEKCNTRYRYDNEDMQRLIPERLNEGFTENDFYTVIDKKTDEWTGTKWEQYLRPYTLFRKDKFEGYLNQRVRPVNNFTASRDEKFDKLMQQIRKDRENADR